MGLGPNESPTDLSSHFTGAMSIIVYELTTFTRLYTLRTGIPAHNLVPGGEYDAPQGSSGSSPWSCNPMISLCGDHTWLALLSKEGRGLIVDVAYGVQELILDVSHPSRAFRGVATGASPGMLALFGSDGLFVMQPHTRSLALGKRAIDIESEGNFDGNSVCEFSGNGELLGILDTRAAYSVIVWDLEERKRYRVRCHGEHLTSFAFSWDGKWMASVHARCIGLWNVERTGSNQSNAETFGKRTAWHKLKANVSDSTTFCSVRMGKGLSSMTVFVCDKNDLLWLDMGITDTSERAENAALMIRRGAGEGGSRCCFLDGGKKAVVWGNVGVTLWDLVTMSKLSPVPHQYLKSPISVDTVPRLWTKAYTSQNKHAYIRGVENQFGSTSVPPSGPLGNEGEDGKDSEEVWSEESDGKVWL